MQTRSKSAAPDPNRQRRAEGALIFQDFAEGARRAEGGRRAEGALIFEVFSGVVLRPWAQVRKFEKHR